MFVINGLLDAVQRQGYEGAYIPQALPVIGALVSIPTALVSFAKAIVKIAQAIFQNVKEGKPFFRPNEKGVAHIKFPMEDAKDLGMIFVNNMANICTLGILNCIFVLISLSLIKKEI